MAGDSSQFYFQCGCTGRCNSAATNVWFKTLGFGSGKPPSDSGSRWHAFPYEDFPILFMLPARTFKIVILTEEHALQSNLALRPRMVWLWVCCAVASRHAAPARHSIFRAVFSSSINISISGMNRLYHLLLSLPFHFHSLINLYISMLPRRCPASVNYQPVINVVNRLIDWSSPRMIIPHSFPDDQFIRQISIIRAYHYQIVACSDV